MPQVPSLFSSLTQKIFRYGLLLFLLAIIIAIYLPGSNGAFYYGDIRPLSALNKVTDINSALIYICSETSGLFGRSLSMLTFLVNVNDWPSTASLGNSAAFFTFNIILHAANGLMVFGLSYFIATLYRGADIEKNKANYWLALATTAFWSVLPMHVSTSLIAIQRMAGLSAFFVFSGLLVYVYGLNRQNLNQQSKNNDGILLQLIGLIIFTVLAIFSKENGALLPIFVLVLESTLFAKVSGIHYRRTLRISACSAGLFLVLVYMAYAVINTGNILPGREFTLTERLLTEPQILLDYIRLAFFPDIAAFNPFHDNYPYVTNLFASTKAWLSATILIIAFVTAIIYRKRYTLYAFAVLWFLTAHLLESSVFNLELYFEHRNYVALFGLCLALIFTLFKTPARYKKLAIFIAIAYWLIFALNLALTTKLWGNKELAANSWFVEQSGSKRASEHLAFFYIKQNKIETAWRVLEKQTKYCPQCINSNIQAMLLSCILKKQTATNKYYVQALRLAKNNNRISKTPGGLEMTHSNIINKQCSLLSLEQLKPINLALEQTANLNKHEKRQVYLNLYKIYAVEQDHQQAIHYLKLAWQVNYSHLVARFLIEQWLITKNYQEALTFANNEMCLHLPQNPLLVKEAQLRCTKALKQIDQKSKLNLKSTAAEPHE